MILQTGGCALVGYQTGVDLLLANAMTITGSLDHSSGPLSSARVSERE